MKKQYTKRQITEAISYWEKQLKVGNYKKVNESAASSTVIIPDIGDLQQTDVFEDLMNRLYGGSAYKSLVSPDEESYRCYGLIYSIADLDLVDEMTFWEYIYEKMNKTFDVGQEVSMEEMTKLLRDWTDENVEELLKFFKRHPVSKYRERERDDVLYQDDGDRDYYPGI